MTTISSTSFVSRANALYAALLLMTVTSWADGVESVQILPDAITCYTSAERARDVGYSVHMDAVFAASEGGLLRWDAQGVFVRKYTRKDGLPSHDVHEIAMTSDGELWIATSHGVSRFDNNRFVNYTEDDGLNDNLVYSVMRDKRDRVYAGTERGVNVLKGNRFVPFNDTHEFSRRATFNMHEAKDGTLWFAKENALTHYLKKGKWQVFQRDATFKGPKADLISNSLLCVITDRDDHPWVGTKLGLGIYDGERWKHMFYPERFFDGKGLKDNRIVTMAMDEEGVAWVGHGNAKDFDEGVGMARFRGDDWHYVTEEEGLPDNRVYRIRIGKEGAAWIATAGGACRMVDDTIKIYEVPDDLQGNHVLDIARLSDGRVEVLTPTARHVFADGAMSEVQQIPTQGSAGPQGLDEMDGVTLPADLKDVVARVHVRDATGRIWLGTRNHGVLFYDQGEWRRVKLAGRDFPAEVTSLCFENDETLWVGTVSEGAFRLSLRDLEM